MTQVFGAKPQIDKIIFIYIILFRNRELSLKQSS